METVTQSLPEIAFRIQLSWLEGAPTRQINVDAVTARRRVSGWASGEVSTSCLGGTPLLVVEPQRIFWRVPVIFTHRLIGHVGEVGSVDMDADTGRMATSLALAEQMLSRVAQLAADVRSTVAQHG